MNVSGSTRSLFDELEKLCRGRPFDLLETIYKVRDFMGRDRDSRPSGYMNHPKFFSAYTAYHLPIHLPEMPWILSHLPSAKSLTPPKILRDLGCGPGTHTLSCLIHLQSLGLKLPDEVHLVDLSGRALESAALLIGKLFPTVKVKAFQENLLHRHTKIEKQQPADWVILGHTLNELGNGPRHRAVKRELLERIYAKHIANSGILWILEPPLREPTLDLMSLRDMLVRESATPSFDDDTTHPDLNELDENDDAHEDLDSAFPGLKILGPCPSSTGVCPMAVRKLGWCYSQPPRTWARAMGWCPWDRELERALKIQLTHPGFSYLVVQKSGPQFTETAGWKVRLTDSKAKATFFCVPKNLQKRPRSESGHRGEILKSTETEPRGTK